MWVLYGVFLSYFCIQNMIKKLVRPEIFFRGSIDVWKGNGRENAWRVEQGVKIASDFSPAARWLAPPLPLVGGLNGIFH